MSNNSSNVSNIVAMGLATGSFLSSGEDISHKTVEKFTDSTTPFSQPAYEEIQKNMGDINHGLGKIGGGYRVVTEKDALAVNLNQENELTPEEEKAFIEQQGGVMVDGSRSFIITFDENQLGGEDKHGNRDIRALGEGMDIMIESINAQITYENKQGREIGFLRCPPEGTREVAQFFNRIIPLPENAYGRVVHLNNYAETLRGDEGIDVRLQRDEKTEVVIIPVLMSGNTTSILPPEVIVDENGELRARVKDSDRIPINKGGYLQADGAYLSLAFANFVVEGEGSFKLQILGYYRNGTIHPNGIYVYNMPEDVTQVYLPSK